MADYTDLELAKMEQAIHFTYTDCKKELQKKWDDYMVKAQSKVDKAWDKYIQAGFHGTPEEAAKAKSAYEKAVLNQTLQNKHYKEMVDQVTDKLTETNEIAVSYLNDQMPKIYCHSYNEFGEQPIKGYSFELVNEDAIKHLIKSGNTNLLPPKKLDPIKDKAWNTKQINSAVLQGILQGESMDKISKRIFPVIHDQSITDKGIIHKNEVSAIRAARTMVTGAQNKGRQDSFERAANDGVKMKRIWVAAHDSHTRDSHIDLDGKEVDVDEPWETEHGKIMYPGDPTAHPAEVYNCRCGIRTKILGFEWPKEEYKSAYAEQYQETGVTKQYYSMLDEDKALGNEFWKTLKAEGKPSQVWKDYLAGNTSPEVTKKIDGILANYKGTGQPVKPGAAKKAAQEEAQKAPKPDLGMYQDKSMTATFYSVKAENKELGKEFWAVLQAEENPSQAWKQYLSGIASKEVTDKLDKILLQHKGEGAWSKPVSTKATAATTKKTLEAEAKADAKKAKLKTLEEKLKKYEEYENQMAGLTGKGFEFTKDGKTVTMFDIHDVDYAMGKGWTPANAEAKEFAKWTKGVDKAELSNEIANLKSTIKEEAEATAKASKLAKAQAQLAAAQGNLDSIKNKTYTGIWKEDVTLADYATKAGSITAKKQWYYDQIENLTHKIDAGDVVESIANAKIAQYEKYIDDLIEFENQGKLYAQYEKDYQKAAQEVKKLTPVSETFGPDAYTQERKDAALWAKDGYLGASSDAEYKALDKYFDKEAKKVHGARTDAEYQGYYHYTWGSGPFNQPLAGFDGSWSESNFKGPNNIDIDNNGYGDKIRGLTSLCEKSKYDRDFWIQTGQSQDTLTGFLGLPRNALSGMTEAQLQQFVGVESKLPQFISGSINKGGGSYVPGDTLFNIYCPAGSEALYVRSDGHFKKSEHEMILQRGGTYKITRIYRGKDHGGVSKLIVDLEVHPENGYDKFQQNK